MASPARLLSPSSIFVHRIHLPTVDSTNSWAKRNAGALDPLQLTAITAGSQTAGRGRGSRVWVSSGDDIALTLAFFLPPASVPSAYLLSPLLCVAARRALAARGVAGAAIKWPNDLVMGGARKVGGILAEMEGPLAAPAGHFMVALGIGLNVNSTPEALGVARPAWPLTTLRAEGGGAPLDVPALTDAVVEAFAGALPLFLAAGFAPFKAEYDAANVLAGRRVRFAAGGGEGVVEGRVVGVGDDGRLLVEDAAGGTRGFLGGEVTGVALAEGGEEVGAPPDAAPP